jgi:hypothetical protein
VGGLILAWVIGEGIIVWRSAVKDHQPPVPGQMLAATGLFALLAVAAEYQPARTAATLFAFGVDIAVLMQVLPGGTDAITGARTSIKTAGKKPPPVTAV